MTLADERRAIRDGVTASRRPSARPTQPALPTDGAAARRAIGTGNTAARRGDAVVEDINRLHRPEPRRKQPLRVIAPVGPVPAATGRGAYKPPPATPSAGGGIASPLTETPGTREWYATGYPSTDGIFEYPADKAVFMTDANGDPVELRYAAPAP